MGKKIKLEEIPSPWKGIEVKPVPEDYEILERYAIREGLAEVVIATPPGPTIEPVYFSMEAPLSPEEIIALDKLKDILSKELEPPKPGEEEEANDGRDHGNLFRFHDAGGRTAVGGADQWRLRSRAGRMVYETQLVRATERRWAQRGFGGCG